MNYRIYYGDGTTLDGDGPEDIPLDRRENVQIVVCSDPDGVNQCGRRIWQQWDYYLWSDHVGGWHVTNNLHDVLFHMRTAGLGPGGVRALLTGGWIRNEDFSKILYRATHDEGLPPRSARPASPKESSRD